MLEAQAFLHLHTHRSGRTASDSRSRLFPATKRPRPSTSGLSNRRLRQEGETYADELGRMTEAVNRRIPQLRPGGARAASSARRGTCCRQEDERFPGLRGDAVSKWKSAEATASA